MGQDGTSSTPSTGAATFRVFGMTHGEGENSYAKNSSLQGTLIRKLLPTFFDAIRSMKLPDPDQVFRIADLGCSSGPNTVESVEAVIEQVRARYSEEGTGADSVPEIQVFFQDLPVNDFNTLFKHLFSQPNSDEEKVRSFMSAAVPGSFYDRLFPKMTINIATSFSTLHWISKVPDAVKDKESPAYNGGHTDLHRSSLATVTAYAEQADKDLDNFLAARALELAPGGLIFMIFGVRQTELFPYGWNPAVHSQEEVWNALVLEGSVSEELRDSYNIPHYCRTMEEVNKQLEKYSSVFEVQKKQVYSNAFESYAFANMDAKQLARMLVMLSRGTSAGNFEAYFGKAATDLFYERWEQVLCELFARRKSGTADKDGASLIHVLALGLRRK